MKLRAGRMPAVPMLLPSGWLKAWPGGNLPWVIGLSCLFLVGVLLAIAMPEIRLQELPE